MKPPKPLIAEVLALGLLLTLLCVAAVAVRAWQGAKWLSRKAISWKPSR